MNNTPFPEITFNGVELKAEFESNGQHATNTLIKPFSDCDPNGRSILINTQFPNGVFKPWYSHKCGGGGPDEGSGGAGHIEVYVRPTPDQ